MSVNIIGDPPEVDRTLTGCYSLNRALRGGWPLGTIAEIYGHEHIGKSTVAYFIAGIVSRKAIALVDLEGFDPEYASACIGRTSFNGDLIYVPTTSDKIPRNHKDVVQDGINMIAEGKADVLILDSVGMYVPIMEAESDIGEGYNTRRAIEMGQISRRLVRAHQARATSCSIFTNHVHTIIGGRGSSTSGGVTLKFLANLRINMRVDEIIKSKEEIVGYSIIGTVEKLRYGGKGGKFRLVNIPGIGIDPYMTLVFDCFDLKIAKRDTTVKLGNRSMGYMSSLIEDSRKGRLEKFQEFKFALEEYEGGIHGEPADPTDTGIAEEPNDTEEV